MCQDDFEALFLLDTNTIIYFFKDIGNVAASILAQSPQDIAIPVISLYELEVGIAKSTSPAKRKKQLNTFASQVNIFQFGPKEARVAAGIRAELEKRGTPIGPYDILIAGTAVSTNSILITNNKKEFARIDRLRIDNWL